MVRLSSTSLIFTVVFGIHVDCRPLGVPEMALALRWTGELNRQLHRNHVDKALVEPSTWLVPRPPSNGLSVRGGETARFSIGHDGNEPPLTVFHAKFPHRPEARGAERWGSSLEEFLQHAVHVLGYNNNQCSRLLATALLFMDRATSVATPRSNPSSQVLPYCTPRTVHRLALAAICLATGPAHTKTAALRLSEAFQIPELWDLVQYMRRALGDFGALVTPTQMDDFLTAWEGSAVLRRLRETQ